MLSCLPAVVLRPLATTRGSGPSCCRSRSRMPSARCPACAPGGAFSRHRRSRHSCWMKAVLVAVVREFLGGLFGADGHAPSLHRWGEREEEATLEPPAYSQSTIPEHVEALKQMMDEVTRLLARCGVKTKGANVYEYPTRRAASSYPAAQDGIPRVEVRLELPDGLSFVERVGFRYCMDKALRASAAAVYWRLVDQIHRQRLWMSERLEELHQADFELSFSHARKKAAVELMEREAVVFPHYALLEGHDRFSRLPQATARKFRPLHRDACDFPSPVELFSEIGARDWFAPLHRERRP